MFTQLAVVWTYQWYHWSNKCRGFEENGCNRVSIRLFRGWWQPDAERFDFDDFVDLSIIVGSSAINNIKNRWITCDFDDLCSGIIDWKRVILGQAHHDGKLPNRVIKVKYSNIRPRLSKSEPESLNVWSNPNRGSGGQIFDFDITGSKLWIIYFMVFIMVLLCIY